MHVPETLKALSPEDFAMMGAPRTAYIKEITVDGQLAYAIHAANGSVLGVAPSRAAAISAALENDFEPVSVH